MKRDELRKVEYKKEDTLYKEQKVVVTKKVGYFHLWNKSVFEDGTENIYALIEEEDGKIINLEANEIKFIS